MAMSVIEIFYVLFTATLVISGVANLVASENIPYLTVPSGDADSGTTSGVIMLNNAMGLPSNTTITADTSSGITTANTGIASIFNVVGALFSPVESALGIQNYINIAVNIAGGPYSNGGKWAYMIFFDFSQLLMLVWAVLSIFILAGRVFL